MSSIEPTFKDEFKEAFTDQEQAEIKSLFKKPLKNHPVYGPAKSGLAMLTKSLAKDLAPSIRVNGIAPGMILWPENEPSEIIKNNILDQIPLKRSGSPEDIANCALFLIKEAPYITGQIIPIDGGRSIGW